MDHLSFTSIKAFKTCPLQYSYRKAHGNVPTEAMTNGSNTHAIIATALGNAAPIPEGTGGPKLRQFIANTLPSVTGLEKKFELSLMGHKIIGFIDAFLAVPEKSKLVIVDWKGHRSSFVDEEQLKLYSYALAKEYPNIEYFECYFFYVKADFPERKFYDRDEIMKYGQDLFDMAVDITSSDFQPDPGPHCNSCAYTEKCPKAKKFDIQPITSLDQAAKYAVDLYAVDAFVKQAEDKLKAFMLDNDLDSIQVSEDNRYYISYAKPTMKTGKVEKEKEKKPKLKKGEVIDVKAEPATTTITVPVTPEIEKTFADAGAPLTGETLTEKQNDIAVEAIKQANAATLDPVDKMVQDRIAEGRQMLADKRKASGFYEDQTSDLPPGKSLFEMYPNAIDKDELAQDQTAEFQTIADPTAEAVGLAKKNRKRETTQQRIDRLSAAERAGVKQSSTEQKPGTERAPY